MLQDTNFTIEQVEKISPPATLTDFTIWTLPAHSY